MLMYRRQVSYLEVKKQKNNNRIAMYTTRLAERKGMIRSPIMQKMELTCKLQVCYPA